jgi:Zn-dependent protease with chaperone function
MYGLMLASFVLKAQHSVRGRDEVEFALAQEQAHVGARHTLISLAASLAGLALFLVGLDAFR